MNKSRIIGLSMLILALFSTNCFASNSELKDYEINEKISIENAEEFEKNIQKNINIDNVKYELQDVSKQENKQNINKEETQTKQKIVYTNNKYDVLNMFENKIEMTKDGMSGILELQNNSLDIKIKDSYIEQYKVALTKKYENVPTNELNDIPKSIEENGVTYYLVNPIWNISQVEKIEGQDVPIAYNGEMQYEGIKERKIVKSYLATVTYIGTLEKEETESITFNIKYKEMPQEEIEEKTNYTPIVVATAGTGILVISGIFLWKNKIVKISICILLVIIIGGALYYCIVYDKNLVDPNNITTDSKFENITYNQADDSDILKDGILGIISIEKIRLKS